LASRRPPAPSEVQKLPGTSIQSSRAKKTGAIRATSVRQMEAVDPRRKASRQVTGFRGEPRPHEIQAVLSGNRVNFRGSAQPAGRRCRNAGTFPTFER